LSFVRSVPSTSDTTRATPVICGPPPNIQARAGG
jgi:hypothetical protein